MGGDIVGEIQLGSERELYKYINHYAVVKKKYSKIILVQVYIIFALPDYSSEVIERHQNLFYGRVSKGLGGNIGCRDKTSSWYQKGSPM